MDKFDKLIKEAVESYEAPYDAQAWANVSSQLGSKGGAMKWIVGSAAAVVLIGGGIYLMQDDAQTPANKVVVENTNTNSTVVPGETQAGNESIAGNSDQTNETVDAQLTTPVVAPNDQNQTSTSVESGITGSENSVNPQNGSDNSNHHQTTGGNQTGGTNDNLGSTQSSGAESVSSARINARFSAETTVACMDTEFLFTPEDINQNVLYVWDFGDGSFSSSKVGSHSFKRAGTFTVSLSLKDSKTNKTLGKSSVEITVNPLPEVEFAYEKSNEMIPTITFINLTEDAESWNWDIKGLKTSTENQFEYTFRKKGTYYVELSAVNQFGCTNSMKKPIDVKSDYNLLAPTAFTPNADNKNDYFIPEALRLMDVTFTMVVYDKAGSLMYQTNNVNQPWDGTNMNDNSLADDGAYVWQVQFKNANGETEYYEGQVIITR